MERQKREQNAIIIYFIFYLFLTIGLIIYLFSSVLSQIQEIETKKIQTKDLSLNIKRIEESGLTFDEFKSLTQSQDNSILIDEILKNLSKDFYTNNLMNTKYSNYKEFIENITLELNSDENNKLISDKKAIISKILPPYSDNSISFSEDALTDYKFINYIESIIETFNFKNSSPIGINKLTLLSDYSISKNSGSGLDSNIYYFPLNLILNGTKSSVIEFLYFIENVGNINIDNTNGNININNNYGFLSKNSTKKVLEGDKLTSDYNIFEHQIFDINKITFNDYIDSTYVTRGDSKFVDFILDTQGNDKYNLSVDLLFYVKGQPNYKLVEYVNNVLSKYQESTKLINLSLSKTDILESDRISFIKYNDSLKQLNDEIMTIRKSLGDESKLEEIYNRATKIDNIISPIFTIVKNKNEL